MCHDLVHAKSTDAKQHDADDYIRYASGRYIEHDEEERVEEKRRAEVAFEGDDGEAYAPYDEQRGEQAQARNLEAHDVVVGDGEQLSVLGEVARKEQHDADLGELAGLDGDKAQVDPQLGAPAILADEDGQQQQDDADEAEGVLIALHHVEVLDHGKRRHHERDGDKQEDELVEGRIGRKARDEGDAHAG